MRASTRDKELTRARRAISGRALAVTLAIATLAFAFVAGCSPASPAVASPSPAGSVGPGPGGAPLPTSWPSDVARAIIRLGAMHAELGTAVAELSAAVQAEDVAEIRKVADRLATFIDRHLESARTLQTQTFPELGGPLVTALVQIRDGAIAIRDGIDKGDSAAIGAGFDEIVAGMRAYARVQPLVAALVPEAIRQTGGLVR